MFDEQELADISQQRESWEEDTLEPFLERGERKERFATVSNHEVDRLYTANDIADLDFDEDLGFPGEPPYTRGPYPTMYRGRTWTMRQFAGFGTAEETNERFHYLIDEGQTGLSTAFDMPSLMGIDSDHPMSEGEVGKEGVAVDTLRDMEILFDEIDISDVSTSFTINPSAAVIYAMYIALADQQGIPVTKSRGPFRTTCSKSSSLKRSGLSPDPSLKIVTDTIEFAVDETPNFHPISISGYHIREAGSTAAQEARVHPRRRVRIRGGLPRTRTRDRRVRAATLVFLQLPQLHLRRDRKISGLTSHLCPHNGRTIRRRTT